MYHRSMSHQGRSAMTAITQVADHGSPQEWLFVAVPLLVLLAALLQLWRTGTPRRQLPRLPLARGLSRMAASLERLSGLPAWCAGGWLVAMWSLVVAVVGFFWDVAWHIDFGRDIELFTVPHTLIITGLLGLGVAGLFSIGLATVEGAPTAWRLARLPARRPLARHLRRRRDHVGPHPPDDDRRRLAGPARHLAAGHRGRARRGQAVGASPHAPPAGRRGGDRAEHLPARVRHGRAAVAGPVPAGAHRAGHLDRAGGRARRLRARLGVAHRGQLPRLPRRPGPAGRAGAGARRAAVPAVPRHRARHRGRVPAGAPVGNAARCAWPRGPDQHGGPGERVGFQPALGAPSLAGGDAAAPLGGGARRPGRRGARRGPRQRGRPSSRRSVANRRA